MTDPAGWSVADPFDLPEWVGAEQLRWSTGETASTALIAGTLAGESGESLGLDLLCVDVAYPAAVVDERQRHDAHQAWHFGQVLMLVDRDGRLAMAVPATRWDADTVCEALRRFAKAIGVPPSQISVVLRL
ncbi:MAG TPA: hypothetical protein VEX15_01465 [Nocardioidaceae bacterium]|nr:hypothetical protein [Nocardioidaceae bacterium]